MNHPEALETRFGPIYASRHQAKASFQDQTDLGRFCITSYFEKLLEQLMNT